MLPHNLGCRMPLVLVDVTAGVFRTYTSLERYDLGGSVEMLKGTYSWVALVKFISNEVFRYWNCR